MDWEITTRFNEVDSVHAHAHQGVDIACPVGTPIHSISNGVVDHVMNEGSTSFGKSVWVLTDGGKEVIYGHLSQQIVHVGDRVHKGDVLALSGNTGHSTGPHVHLQVDDHGLFVHMHPIDPTRYVDTMMNGDVMSTAGGIVPELLAVGVTAYVLWKLVRRIARA